MQDILNNPTLLVEAMSYAMANATEDERLNASWAFNDLISWVAFEEKTLEMEWALSCVIVPQAGFGSLERPVSRQLLHLQPLQQFTEVLCQIDGGTGRSVGHFEKFPGFQAMMRIRQQEYVSWMQSSGIRVFIHGMRDVVFAQSVRYTAAPGTQLNIQVSLVFATLMSTHRLTINDWGVTMGPAFGSRRK